MYVKKLSEFKIATSDSELNEDSYIVIISMMKILPNSPRTTNIIVNHSDGSAYNVFILKGMFKNVKMTSATFTEDAEVRLKHPGMEVILAGILGGKEINYLMYESWQKLIDGCTVFVSDKKEDFEVDSPALEWIINNKDCMWENCLDHN